MAQDFLADMAALSRERVVRARSVVPASTLRDKALATEPAPPLVLRGFDVMAEVKLRSPSAGLLMRQPATALGEAWSRARAYQRGGACAISVLTEPTRFDGSLAQLATAARAVKIPVMRKDFVVDPWQVYEARVAGAGGVLLILRIVDDAQLDELLDAIAECGMFALVEAFDAADLARTARLASRAGPRLLVGVNTRDLQTLEVDMARLEALARQLPSGVPAVAESGLRTAEDAARVATMGYSVALVGTALMDTDHPAERIAEMVRAGREVGCASA